MNPTAENAAFGLTLSGCEARQQRLIERLQESGSDSALISDPRHIYYFTGFLTASHHASLWLVRQDGTSHLVLPVDVDLTSVLATRVSVYESNKYATLVDDQFRAALNLLEQELRNGRTIAVDSPQLALFGGERFRDLTP